MDKRPTESPPPKAPAVGGISNHALWQRRLLRERQLKLHDPLGGTARFFKPHFRAWSMGMVMRFLGLYRWGHGNSRAFVWRRHDLYYADLSPALEGFRVLHLSDFHFMEDDPRFARDIAAFLGGAPCELCLLTGDYFFGHHGSQAYVESHLREALSGVRARHGVYAILGNHDTSRAVPAIEAGGAAVLVNEGRLIEHEGARLWIGGADDPRKFECDSLANAFAGAPRDAFGIALVHTPERVREAYREGARLYLCGHTHGGQLRLPWLGAIEQNAQCDPEFCQPLWRYRELWGCTSYGMGTTDVPVRFNCPPEAVLLTLRRETPSPSEA